MSDLIYCNLPEPSTRTTHPPLMEHVEDVELIPRQGVGNV